MAQAGGLGRCDEAWGRESWLEEHRQIRRADIVAFADELGRDPGIVVGQLHHRGGLSYSRYRDLLTPVNEVLGAWISR